MSIPNNWGDWRPNLTPHTGDLQATDLIECTMIVGGVPINTAITGQQIIDAASGGGLTTADRMVIVGRNSTGVTLYAGTIIYISGSTGNRPNYVKAQANTEATSAGTFGVIVADIANNSDGNALIIGTLDNLDTRAVATHPFTTDTLVDGDTLYLSPTTAGYVTRVKPSAPNHIVYIGKVIRTHPNLGTIVYRIQNGYELNEIHDVEITSVANNDLIQYDSAALIWKNRRLSTAGIQPTLVSGTNIKTINSTSLLGSGDIVIGGGGLTVGTTAIASGTIGGILFQNGSNLLGQDAALFWDNTNKRLGVGATPASTVRLDVRAQGALSTDLAFRVRNSANTRNIISVQGDETITLGATTNPNTKLSISGSSIGVYSNATLVGFSATINPATLINAAAFGGFVRVSGAAPSGNYYGVSADIDSGNVNTILNAVWGSAHGNGTNYGGYFRAYGGTSNHALYVQDGDMRFGATTTNKIGFWNKTPILQPTTAIAAGTFVVGVGTAVTDASTFDGYTLGQIARALRNMGILA